MKNKKTYYHLVLDKSGSMSSCWQQTIAGFTDQLVKINQLAKEFPEQEFFVSLCVFDTRVNFPQSPVLVSEAQNMQLEFLRPGGSTALFDAIGESIQKLEFMLGNSIQANEASVVMVILTDGHENASTRFSSRQITEKMEALRNTDKWSFAFIGADFDITQTADAFRAGAWNHMNLGKENMNAVFERVNTSLFHYANVKRRGGFKKNFFDDNEK